MRSPVSSPRLSDEVSNPSQLHLTQKPHTKHPLSCWCVSAGVLTFLCVVSLFVHCVKARWYRPAQSRNTHALRHTPRDGWETLSARSGLLVTLRDIRFRPIALTIKMPPEMLPSHSSTPGNCITAIQRTHNFINSHAA